MGTTWLLILSASQLVETQLVLPRLCVPHKTCPKFICGVQRPASPGPDKGVLELVGPRPGLCLCDFNTSYGFFCCSWSRASIWVSLEPGVLPFPPSSCEIEALGQRVESSILDLREISKVRNSLPNGEMAKKLPLHLVNHPLHLVNHQILWFLSSLHVFEFSSLLL